MKKENLLNERVEIVLFLLSCNNPINIRKISEAIYSNAEDKNCKKIARHLNYIEENNKNIFQYINISKRGKELFYDIKLDNIKINNYDPILSSFVFKLLDTSSKEKIRKKNDETIQFAIEHGYNLIFDKHTNSDKKNYDIYPIYYFKEYNKIIGFDMKTYKDDNNITAIFVDDTMTQIKIIKRKTNDRFLNFQLTKINHDNNELLRIYNIKNEFSSFDFKLDSFNSYNVKGKINKVIIEIKKTIKKEFVNKFPISINHYQIIEEENNEDIIIKLELMNINVDKIISFLSTQDKEKFKLYINDKLYEFNF